MSQEEEKRGRDGRWGERARARHQSNSMGSHDAADVMAHQQKCSTVIPLDPLASETQQVWTGARCQRVPACVLGRCDLELEELPMELLLVTGNGRGHQSR